MLPRRVKQPAGSTVNCAEEDKLQSPIVVFPTGKDRPRLGVWLFAIAWLVGNVALIGLENQGQEMIFMCAFAIACGLWWGGLKLGGLTTGVGTAVGFIVLVIWTLSLISFALSLRSFASDVFFWASSAMLLVLVVLAAVSKTSPATSSKPD